MVGELTTDDTDLHGRMKESGGRAGPWMSPREVGSRQQNGASMFETVGGSRGEDANGLRLAEKSFADSSPEAAMT